MSLSQTRVSERQNIPVDTLGPEEDHRPSLSSVGNRLTSKMDVALSAETVTQVVILTSKQIVSNCLS